MRRAVLILAAFLLAGPAWSFQKGGTQAHNHTSRAGDGGQLSNVNVTGYLKASTTGQFQVLITTAIQAPTTAPVQLQASIQFSSGAVYGIVGSSSIIPAGLVGEKKEFFSGVGWTSYPASTNAWGNCGSIYLSTGNWIVSAVTTAQTNTAAGNTYFAIAIASTSAGDISSHIPGYNNVEMAWNPTTVYQSASIPSLYLNLSQGTTYYLKLTGNFTSGQPRFNGRMTAIRMP